MREILTNWHHHYSPAGSPGEIYSRDTIAWRAMWLWLRTHLEGFRRWITLWPFWVVLRARIFKLPTAFVIWQTTQLWLCPSLRYWGAGSHLVKIETPLDQEWLSFFFSGQDSCSDYNVSTVGCRCRAFSWVIEFLGRPGLLSGVESRRAISLVQFSKLHSLYINVSHGSIFQISRAPCS